jgi:acetyl esterase/lipase
LFIFVRHVIMACAIAVLPFGAAAQDAKPAKPTGSPFSVADFASLPAVQRPTLSPDGTRYAAKVAIKGKQYFAIVPIGGGEIKWIATGELDLNWWRWVGDKWVVVGVGQVQPVLHEEFYIRRALAVDAGTGRITTVSPRDSAQNADDVVWAADDGLARVMLSYQTSVFADEEGFWPQVREIDLATGRTRLVQRPLTGVFGWYADGAGAVRMGIAHGDDGRSTRVYHRPAAGTSLKLIARARNRDERVMIPAIFPPEPGKAMIIDDDDDGYSALYDLDLNTMTRGRQIAASPGYDIAGLSTDPSGTRLLGVRVNEDRPETRWLDPDLKLMAGEVRGMVKGAEAHIASISRDHGRAIIQVGSATAPGAYMLYDRATGSMQPIAYTNDAFKMRRMHPVTTLRYKARDGLEIAAVLTLPKGGGKNLPLIVMPHGGPFARDTEEWDWWTQFLADRGYAVVQPNYRGSSGYGTPFTRRGEGQWGLAMQDDLNDAVKALAERGVADPKRACIVGASYGGYAAMRAAERDPGLFRCAVSYAGVSDLKAMVRYDSRFLYSGVRSDWMRKQAPDLAAVSPINAVPRFSTPLLMVHGAKDRVVPVKQSRGLAQKLKAAGKPATYIEQPEADHHFSRAEDRLQFLRALDDFLKTHNPA